MLKKILALLMPFIFLIMTTQAQADWVSDWVQQETSTTPNYFQGQQRGFFTAGSFNARWQHANNFNPINISPPSIKVGCGGIDIFGGAFNFVNPQYLVQQLQTMLEAAPAIAFEIALKTLCEQCSQTLNAIEAIIQKLNGLQFNACKATKAAVFTLASALSPEVAEKNQAMADETHQTLSGIANMFTSIFENEQGTSATSPSTSQPASSQSSYQQMISGCPADIQEFFGTPGTTLLEQIGNALGLPQSYIDLMRGYVGDVQINVAPNPQNIPQLVITKMAPCRQNQTTGIDDFYNGSAYAEPPGGPSQCSNANVMNLEQYVQDNISGILNAMQTGAPLTQTQQNIIQTSPVSIYQALKVGIATGQADTIGATLADLTAKAYAYGAMSDLLSQAQQLYYKMNTLIGKTGQSTSPNCKISITAANTEVINGFISQIMKQQSLIEQSYVKSAHDINTINSLINNYAGAKLLVKKAIAHTINPAAIK